MDEQALEWIKKYYQEHHRNMNPVKRDAYQRVIQDLEAELAKERAEVSDSQLEYLLTTHGILASKY